MKLAPVFGATLALICAASVCAPTVWAQKAKTTKTKTTKTAKLPTAASVLDASSKAVGGGATTADMKSLVMLGSLKVTGQNLTGTVEIRMAFPNKVYSAQTITGIGVFERAFDGENGWSRDPINGLQTLSSSESAQLKSQANEAKQNDWHALLSKVEMLGIRKVGAANAYAIRQTPIDGSKPAVLYYDTKTYLPVRGDAVIETASGSVPTQIFNAIFARSAASSSRSKSGRLAARRK